MTNSEKYLQCFTECFGIGEQDCPALNYQDIPQWDSVGHMSLISSLEDTFDIMMDAEDIIDFNSFQKGKEILASRYQIEF